MTVSVYFIAGQLLTETSRTLTADSGLRAVQELLDDLTAGPNAADRRRGLSSALPPATRLTVTGLNGSLATLDLTVDQPPVRPDDRHTERGATAPARPPTNAGVISTSPPPLRPNIPPGVYDLIHEVVSRRTVPV